ncbi:MAG: hypothetical protein KY428_03495 [Bacteroidetes bacterium]|nr:hypothetical protein [Bacteroidota bacterium]
MVWIAVAGQTTFSAESGMYGSLLSDLKNNLYQDARIKKVHLDNKDRLMFISWIRDHVHVMKAYKYWEKDMGSYLDFFMGRQTPKGMYYDYWMSYKDQNVGQLYFTNVFDKEFYFVDVEQQLFFFRMPIEADLEYLLVEGAYTNWQTSGDTTFLNKWLPALERGLAYEMTDPLRWSEKHQLVKRPYSIDTWDFTSEPDSLTGADRLIYHIGNSLETPKGIMHGDNSGMYHAFKQLAIMQRALGSTARAKESDARAEGFRTRLNQLCWNGNYYAHYVPIDPVPTHINMNPAKELSLSNTYSINRGATTPQMAVSILEAYKGVWKETKAQSVAEWYGVYPPIEPHFGDYEVGEYMNGAVLPLVGGELAKAAFQNGQEAYGVELLQRLNKIMDMNDRSLPGCVNRDGSAQSEDVPKEWGQAAFVSALVEGLAGVVDKDIQFRQVEISPRWLFAGVDKVSVSVGYGGDGQQVSYEYSYQKAKKTIQLKTMGKFNRYRMRIPLPANAKRAEATLNGHSAGVTLEKVHTTLYAVVDGEGNDNTLTIRFK